MSDVKCACSQYIPVYYCCSDPIRPSAQLMAGGRGKGHFVILCALLVLSPTHILLIPAVLVRTYIVHVHVHVT